MIGLILWAILIVIIAISITPNFLLIVFGLTLFVGAPIYLLSYWLLNKFNK